MNPIKRRILIAILGLGTIAGFGSGFAHTAWAIRHHHDSRRAAFEQHIADVCVEAAKRAQ